MPDTKHGYWHTKYDAANQLNDWVMKDPERLSYYCDCTSCNLLWGPLLVLFRYCDHTKGEGGLVSERGTKLGTLKNDQLQE